MTPWLFPQDRDRLAEICGQYLGKGQLVSLEGRLQTRRWEDDRKIKHYRTEVVASSVKFEVSPVDAIATVGAQIRAQDHSLLS